jgi:hypothetical protein
MWTYIKGWFLFDILASFPFNWITPYIGLEPENGGVSDYNGALRLFRLPRLYKITKIFRFVKIFNFVNKSKYVARLQTFFKLNAGIMKLIVFVMIELLFVHLVACLWYFAASIMGVTPDNWIMKFNVHDASNERKYFASLYWAFSTALTVGYGDISAYTNIERIISIIWMMVGVAFYSFTIGILASVLNGMDN